MGHLPKRAGHAAATDVMVWTTRTPQMCRETRKLLQEKIGFSRQMLKRQTYSLCYVERSPWSGRPSSTFGTQQPVELISARSAVGYPRRPIERPGWPQSYRPPRTQPRPPVAQEQTSPSRSLRVERDGIFTRHPAALRQPRFPTTDENNASGPRAAAGRAGFAH